MAADPIEKDDITTHGDATLRLPRRALPQAEIGAPQSYAASPWYQPPMIHHYEPGQSNTHKHCCTYSNPVGDNDPIALSSPVDVE
jgi:hypothetical protein